MSAFPQNRDARNHDMNATAMTDQDLDRLEGLLDDPALEDAMRLDEMQGFLCAALAGPQPLAVEDMVAEMIGEPGDPAAPAVAQACELAGRLVATLQGQLATGEVVHWLYPESSAEDSPMDYGPWCMAYLHGVDLADRAERLQEARQIRPPHRDPDAVAALHQRADDMPADEAGTAEDGDELLAGKGQFIRHGAGLAR